MIMKMNRRRNQKMDILLLKNKMKIRKNKRASVKKVVHHLNEEGILSTLYLLAEIQLKLM